MANVPPIALRVLFVEDSSDDINRLLRELAAHGFQCEWRGAAKRGEFVAALQAGTWDIIISTHALNGFTSGDALGILRDQGIDTPVIIVSDAAGEDAAVASMRAGAQDYVTKHNLYRLGPAVQRELREAANRRLQRSTQAALQASEQRLRHAQKMESVGRLAAGIAHDFNNLLTAILGFSEFLVERLPDEHPAHGDAVEIRTAALRATALTKQLLAFSRQQALERRIVDLIAVVKELQPMIDRLIGEDIRCDFDLAAAGQWVLIDPTQFEQVLMNLVVNARDAMPGGGSLRVSIAREKLDALRAGDAGVPPGTYVTLSVTDTGEGIAKDTLDNIFEPFFTTKPRGQGTGLGLSTVFGIVRQNGGVIEVDSVVKRGTTFRVYFPLSSAPGIDQPLPAPPPAKTAHGGTILLAEDEHGVRTFLETALRRAGHKVIATDSGPHAVAAGNNARESIDLLIADVVMPGLSGPEVAEQLRRVHPTMQTLFLSGYASHPALRNRITEPGAFLQKPFTVDALMLKVRERLAVAR